MKVIESLEKLKALEGTTLEPSNWLQVTQERINAFAEATGDFQWVHIDVERCKKESPFGAPIAHGYLTLSLIPVMFAEVIKVENIAMAVNYGVNKVRFTKPVPAGESIRLVVKVKEVGDIRGGVKFVVENTVELKNGGKPACIAESIVLYYN